MGDAFICDAARTPIGGYGGALAPVRPDDLAARPISAGRAQRVDPGDVDDVILGCANQAGEDNRNVARMAALLAGLPVRPRRDGQPPVRLGPGGGHGARAVKPGEGDCYWPAAWSR